MENYLIAQVAEQSDVNKETIRYYESIDLIPEPRRSATGYRLYTEESVDRIRFIKRAQTLGFTLNEIAELLSLEKKQSGNSKPVHMLALRKLEEIESKIMQLQQLRSALQDLSCLCNGKASIAHCPIIKSLTSVETTKQKGEK